MKNILNTQKYKKQVYTVKLQDRIYIYKNKLISILTINYLKLIFNSIKLIKHLVSLSKIRTVHC